MAARNTAGKKASEIPVWVGKHCRDCSNKKVCHKHPTLSIKGEPTLARCPEVPNRCVLLSQDACSHYKP